MHTFRVNPLKHRSETAADFLCFYELDKIWMRQVFINRYSMFKVGYCFFRTYTGAFSGRARILNEIPLIIVSNTKTDVTGILVIIYLEYLAIFTEKRKIEW
jgi:hypothetical protein